MRTARSTGRIARWRGQILHVCGILAVTLRDRGLDEENDAYKVDLQKQLKHVFEELASQCESVRKVVVLAGPAEATLLIHRTSTPPWLSWMSKFSGRWFRFNGNIVV